MQDFKKTVVALKTFEYLPFSKDSGMKRTTVFLYFFTEKNNIIKY